MWNSHGVWVTYGDLREVEVEERGNYTHQQFDTWAALYGVGEATPAIWGQDTFYGCCELYGANPVKLEGTVIEESHDGDGGFIVVFCAPTTRA